MTEQRIPLDDLTSDQHDALQDEVSYLQQLSAEQGQALTRACFAREEQRARAERAEADLDRVQQAACRTAENLRRAEQRAEQAEAAVERVREVLADPLLHTTDRERQGERCLARQIRAALDEPQPSTTTEACTCKHPIGEHSIYGCADGCGCEWMPKRNATKQPSPTA